MGSKNHNSGWWWYSPCRRGEKDLVQLATPTHSKAKCLLAPPPWGRNPRTMQSFIWSHNLKNVHKLWGMFTRCYWKVWGFLFKLFFIIFFEISKEYFQCKFHVVPHLEECSLGVIAKCGLISWEPQGKFYFTCKVHLVPHFEECLLGVNYKVQTINLNKLH
jgi:hypothetical protein